jgi:restriction endonuclease S subunit
MIQGFQSVPLEKLLDSYIGGLWGEEPGRSEVDVKVMRITELGANGTSDLSTSAIRSLTHKQVASRKLHEGDLVLEKSGGGPKTPVGRVALIGAMAQDIICSNFMLLMRPNHSLVLSKYLHHFLTYLHVTGQTIPLQSSSTNIRNISTPDYMQVQVPVPPLDEQKRIVETLDDHLSRLDKALAETQNAATKATTYWHAMLHSLLFRDESGDLASTVELGSLAELVMGQAPAGSDCNKNGVGTPFVKVGEFGASYPEVREWTTKPLKMARSSDVLICVVGATIGKLNLGIDCAIGRSVAAIRPGLKLRQKYLFYFLQTKVLEIRASSKGSAQGVITRQQLLEMSIPDLSIESQDLIIQSLETARSSLDQALSDLDKVSSSTSTLRRSVLNSAFTGTLLTKGNEHQ